MTSKTLDELQADRDALMEWLILAVAANQGVDVSDGIPEDQRRFIAEEAEYAYDEWCFKSIKASKPLVSDGSQIQNIMAELYELDDLVHAMTDGGREPDDPLP
jgi:hypothetical protein